jgi:AcrR family transcriptional regulator
LPAAPAGGDVFARLEQMVYAGMRFQLDDPRLARLAANLYDPDVDPDVHALHRELRAAGRAAVRAFLDEARRGGSLPAAVDLDVAAVLVAQVLGPGLAEVLLARTGADLHGFIKNPAVARSVKEAELRALVRSVVGVLRHGLAGAPAPKAKKERRT